jgi:ABC-2 type transport system permease protein
MYPLRLIGNFIKISAQEETAYRANFWINILHSLLNFSTGVLGVGIIFSQAEVVQGWDYNEALAVLGVYLTVNALRDLFIGPGLDSVAGMDGEIWLGTFDFTLLRPVNTQFLISFRRWRLFALFDLLLGLGVVVVALYRMGQGVTLLHAGLFLLMLVAGMLVLYAVLLIFASLVFWNPGFFFTWIFSSIFQLARYPVGMYPGWLRLVLTWIIPVGLITSVPAEALAGRATAGLIAASLVFAMLLLAAASALFLAGTRRYASASS